MADPLTIVASLVRGILSRVGEAKTNEEECKSLARIVDKTLQVLKTVEANELSDQCATKAIDLVHDALNEASRAVENCCNASFFSALMWPENYSTPIKEAAEKLKYAMSQVPLASTNMVADAQSDMVAMHDQLRHTIFNKRAAMAHQTIALRDQLEKGFHQNAQETEEIKALIQKLAHEQFASKEKLKKELASLKRHANKAHMAKENLEEYAINQIIAVIAESLVDVNEARACTQDVTESLCCPISKEIMKDPIVVKESGMIYDRANIIEWFERGHRYDPLTNVELKCKDLIHCHALREVCKIWIDEVGNSSSCVKDVEEEDQKLSLLPGLYEGFGKLFMKASIIHVHQTLFLEPNGRVTSYSFYGKSNDFIQRNGLEIGGGEWESKTMHLSFGDGQYSYHGSIDLAATYQQSRMKLKAIVFDNRFEEKEYNCIFVYSLPHIQYRCWMHPKLLQMESEVINAQNNVEYIGKIVLSLEMDNSICGWMWFDSTSSKLTILGRIVHGRWEKEGKLKFSIFFPPQNTPLDSNIAPTNECAEFRVVGSLDFGGKLSRPSFTSNVWKTSDDDMTRDKVLSITPLDGVRNLEFPLVRAKSITYHHLSPKDMQFFQGFTSTLTTTATSSHYVYIQISK